MASQAHVSNQITDSVTQTNVKVLAEAPALAIGTLYQATAQALSNAAHNATNAQNQMNVILQAATTQGVMQIYSVDTVATNNAIDDAANNATEDQEAKPNNTTAPNLTLEDAAQKAAAALPTEINDSVIASKEAITNQANDAETELNNQIEKAVKFALECNLDSAEPFNHAVQQAMEAYISALKGISDNAYNNALGVIKIAGISTVLKAMIQMPNQQTNYTQLLNTIKSL